jgi:hypothetical protein
MIPQPPSPYLTSTTLTPTPHPPRHSAPSVPLLLTQPPHPQPRRKQPSVPRQTSSRVSRHPVTKIALPASGTAATKLPTRTLLLAARRVLSLTVWPWTLPQASAALCTRTLGTTAESRSRSHMASLMVLDSRRRLDVDLCSSLEAATVVSWRLSWMLHMKSHRAMKSHDPF